MVAILQTTHLNLFCRLNIIDFYSNSIHICSQCTHHTIGWNKVLELNGWQTIIWTNNGIVHSCTAAKLGKWINMDFAGIVCNVMPSCTVTLLRHLPPASLGIFRWRYHLTSIVFVFHGQSSRVLTKAAFLSVTVRHFTYFAYLLNHIHIWQVSPQFRCG